MKIIQVGSGGWGAGWLDVIGADARWELAALASRGGPNLDAARAKHGLSDDQCFTDLDAALDVEADVVLVSVPHSHHVSVAREAIDRGHAVLIEKPLAAGMAEARELVELIRTRGARVWVSQNFRFREELFRMRASLTDRLAGRPAWASVTFREGPNRRELPSWRTNAWRSDQWSFVIDEIAIHHFDMMRYLFEREPVRLRADGWTPPWSQSTGPEVVSADVEFDGGLRVHYEATSEPLGYTTGYEADWLVQTDRGTLRWTRDGLIADSGADEEVRLAEPEGFSAADRAGVLLELERALAGEQVALPTAEDNLRSFAMVAATRRAVEDGGWVELA